MKKFVDPFLYNIPHLDIHGYDRYSAVAMIKNFIENNLRIDNKKIIVIHGKGSGILKKTTHDYLKSDKRVLEYKTNNYNDGETIIILK
ncbi:MAG: Smr/MutS family protein [bacterium]|nr:Smr/MutS family protein [bacterium]